MDAKFKFEPFDRVLVRDYEDGPWWGAVYSHYSAGSTHKHKIADGQSGFYHCIPYTPETAHLLGTTDPYEPPKPPHEYKWGDRVEVLYAGLWRKGLFVKHDHCTSQPIIVAIQGYDDTRRVNVYEVRPLEAANE